jgi:hypothetical protein
MERFQDTGNLLTVIQTCRRQRRSVSEFFDQARTYALTENELCVCLLTFSDKYETIKSRATFK